LRTIPVLYPSYAGFGLTVATRFVVRFHTTTLLRLCILLCHWLVGYSLPVLWILPVWRCGFMALALRFPTIWFSALRCRVCTRFYALRVLCSGYRTLFSQFPFGAAYAWLNAVLLRTLLTGWFAAPPFSFYISPRSTVVDALRFGLDDFPGSLDPPCRVRLVYARCCTLPLLVRFIRFHYYWCGDDSDRCGGEQALRLGVTPRTIPFQSICLPSLLAALVCVSAGLRYGWCVAHGCVLLFCCWWTCRYACGHISLRVPRCRFSLVRLFLPFWITWCDRVRVAPCVSLSVFGSAAVYAPHRNYAAIPRYLTFTH